MKFKGILGVPVHAGFITKKKSDPRRDKRKCIYYIKERNMCELTSARCQTSSHCFDYNTKKEDISTTKKFCHKKKIYTPKTIKTLHKECKPAEATIIDIGVKEGDNVFFRKYGVGKVVKVDNKNSEIVARFSTYKKTFIVENRNGKYVYIEK